MPEVGEQRGGFRFFNDYKYGKSSNKRPSSFKRLPPIKPHPKNL